MQDSFSLPGTPQILQNTIRHAENTVGGARLIFVVRDHQDRLLILCRHRLQERNHFLAVFAVQVAGRLYTVSTESEFMTFLFAMFVKETPEAMKELGGHVWNALQEAP